MKKFRPAKLQMQHSGRIQDQKGGKRKTSPASIWFVISWYGLGNGLSKHPKPDNDSSQDEFESIWRMSKCFNRIANESNFRLRAWNFQHFFRIITMRLQPFTLCSTLALSLMHFCLFEQSRCERLWVSVRDFAVSSREYWFPLCESSLSPAPYKLCCLTTILEVRSRTVTL